MAVKAGRAVWAKRVERWKESGLTAKEFATEIGVNPRTLSHWKWMLSKGERGREKTGVKKRTKASGAGAGELHRADHRGAGRERPGD